MKKIPFGKTSDGREASLYELCNGGLTVEILDYGAAIYSIRTPDREGRPVDVILAPATLEQFTTGYFDVVCGRYANRIAGAKFTLNGKTYELAKNDGENHLHGGVNSFSRKLWEVKAYTDAALTLSLFSPDGDEGYPGDLEVTVTYEVTADGGLELKYWAESSADTVINLTNHAFFNLNGHDQGRMGEHTLQIENLTVSVCKYTLSYRRLRSLQSGISLLFDLPRSLR